MFSIFKKSRPEIPVGQLLQTDMHSHFVPGIDDGAADITTSLELITGMQKLGFSKLITTPHIIYDLYRNDRSTIEPAYNELITAKEEKQLNISVSFAAEYMLDDHFNELLDKGEPLLTVKDNLVLIEMSFVSPPIGYKETIFNLQLKGYQPILAHPERYGYAAKNRAMYRELKEAGCLFQVNCLSFAGYYGPESAAAAKYLVNEDMIDLAGTDCHHLRHLAALHNPSISKALLPLVEKGRLQNNLLT
ncbi:MAG TPA: CpsB/CapC family capsule biosynthesis tyrosine phosphatase [Parasegetibacter sp.]|jgi:protein-tyrosine phosphatase